MTSARDERMRFGGSLVLAGTMAVALPATVLMFAPSIGRDSAIGLHWAVAGAAWVAWLAPGLRKSVAAGALALLVGVALTRVVGVAHAAPGVAVVVVMAGLLAAMRSGVVRRAPWSRVFFCEIAIGAAAVAMAQWLAGPSLLEAMAALWGFFLVQSVFGLWPGLEPGRREGRHGDGFERAAARLTRLLEEA